MTSDRQALPHKPQPLALNVSIAKPALSEFLAGYESQNQSEKWSWRFVDPWLQMWRPNFGGTYCFAVRFEEASSTTCRLAEAWAGHLAVSWFGPDPGLVLKSLLEHFANKYDPDEPLLNRLEMSESPIGLTFSGVVRTEQDVDDVAKALKERIRSSPPGRE